MPFFNQIPQITTAWAAKPLATAYVGNARITDVGVGGSNWYSDGTSWKHDGFIIMQQKGGYILHSMLAANASTFSQTGTTVTVTSAGHGLTAATHNGMGIYLILNGVGTDCTNFTYVNANSFTCTSPTSQTASGAITTNTSETIITPLSLVIPAGLLGESGVINVSGTGLSINSVNTRTTKLSLDTANYLSLAISNATVTQPYNRFLRNVTSGKQMSGTVGTAAETATTVSTLYTVDTTIAKTHTTRLQASVANEWACILNQTLTVIPS